jgi:hypothetical protein
MASVLVIGSSQVNRLQQYINNHPAFENFNLNGHATVSLIGISGGCIKTIIIVYHGKMRLSGFHQIGF